MKAIFTYLFLCTLISYSQEISTIAGVGTVSGYTGNGGDATQANLEEPWDLDVDAAGNIYFSEQVNSVVRRVDANTGIITNIFGNGTTGVGQNGELGPDYELIAPGFIHIDHSNNVLYVSDYGASKIYKMSLSDSTVSLVAGNGTSSYTPDGNQAAGSAISYPMGLTIGTDGLLYYVENGNNIIRRINSDGTLTTIAGISGTSGVIDGTLITSTFNQPFGLERDANNRLYVAETINHKIRRIDMTAGTVLTVAGTGSAGFNGDGLPALATTFTVPHGFDVDASGNIFIGDNDNHRVRKVDAVSGLVSTVAGNGNAGYSGDGGDPLAAELSSPLGVHVDDDGNILFCELDNHVVRKVKVCKDPDVPTIQIQGTTTSYSDTIFCSGDFNLNIIGGDLNSATDWVWYKDGCGQTVVAAGSSIAQSLTQSTQFWVRGEGVCIAEDSCQSVVIKIDQCVEEPIEVGIITAFSPNDDGVNDFLYLPEADSIPTNTVQIINRWGDEVWSITNYDNVINVWEGKDQSGAAVGVGTYFYIFESDNVRRSNWVQVVR
jgi:gliding motility-associated-like protein